MAMRAQAAQGTGLKEGLMSHSPLRPSQSYDGYAIIKQTLCPRCRSSADGTRNNLVE